MTRVDLTGQRFGRLLVLEPAAPSSARQSRFACVCDCGTSKIVLGTSLTSGVTSSCGCLQRERAAAGHMSHGQSRARAGRRPTRTYKTWRSMLERCSNPKAIGYDIYGGRGIRVCERWQAFEAFLEDMGERPAGKTLDRFPNKDGNYEPGNCRWATPQEQARNTRSNRVLTVDGVSLSIAAWQERTGLPKGLIADRLYRGWSPRDAALTPVLRGRRRARSEEAA